MVLTTFSLFSLVRLVIARSRFARCHCGGARAALRLRAPDVNTHPPCVRLRCGLGAPQRCATCARSPLTRYRGNTPRYTRTAAFLPHTLFSYLRRYFTCLYLPFFTFAVFVYTRSAPHHTTTTTRSTRPLPAHTLLTARMPPRLPPPCRTADASVVARRHSSTRTRPLPLHTGVCCAHCYLRVPAVACPLRCLPRGLAAVL